MRFNKSHYLVLAIDGKSFMKMHSSQNFNNTPVLQNFFAVKKCKTIFI